jgi:ATP-dependent Clp protease protease subunit
MKAPIFAMGKSVKDISSEKATEIVNKWISISNAKTNEATIEIDGDIGEDWWSGSSENTVKAVKDKLKEIANLKAKKIIVNINSLGGDVSHGLGIHDILAQHEAEIETNVQGLTASAATIIAQAGDVRKMSDNALYLIHQPWSIFLSNVTELEQDLENMRTINDRLVAIYTKRSGKSEDEIRALMNENNGNGKWISADDAKEIGLIDEIYEPMKAAALVLSSDVKNALHLPDLPTVQKSIPFGLTREQAEEEEQKRTQFLDIMKEELKTMFAGLKGWFTDNFKKEGSEESAIPAEAQAKLDELDAKIEEIGNQEDKITALQDQVNTLSGEKDTAANSLKEAQDKIAALQTELVQAKANSTKKTGKEGMEDAEDLDDELNKSLASDIAKLKGRFN